MVNGYRHPTHTGVTFFDDEPVDLADVEERERVDGALERAREMYAKGKFTCVREMRAFIAQAVKLPEVEAPPTPSYRRAPQLVESILKGAEEPWVELPLNVGGAPDRSCPRRGVSRPDRLRRVREVFIAPSTRSFVRSRAHRGGRSRVGPLRGGDPSWDF